MGHLIKTGIVGYLVYLKVIFSSKRVKTIIMRWYTKIMYPTSMDGVAEQQEGGCEL